MRVAPGSPLLLRRYGLRRDDSSDLAAAVTDDAVAEHDRYCERDVGEDGVLLSVAQSEAERCGGREGGGDDRDDLGSGD